MVSSVASVKVLNTGRIWPAVAARAPETSRTETEQAPAGRGAASGAGRVEGKARLSPASMSALLQAQEHRPDGPSRGRAFEALGEVLQHLLERLEHKKPKKPKPHDPPPPPPPPPPSPPPADTGAETRYLEGVLARLREPMVSQYPTEPFSQRNKPPAPAVPAAAAGSPFYTPGVFTPVQASALRTVAQGQAAIAMLQAGQMSLYAAMGAPLPAFGVNRIV